MVNLLWEKNKAPANQLNLLEQLDFLHKLSSQLEWQREHPHRPVRLIYTSSGQPTAAILRDDSALVENVLFWVACKSIEEANYLMAIINSDTSATEVHKYTVRNWSGKIRHLHKHLWKLPIPEFEASQRLHTDIAAAGAAAAAAAQEKLERVREVEGDKFTVAKARSELRKWLSWSDEGQEVERVVAKLLAGG